jgi:putative PIN family toxin of toxin-antitoxin system
MKAPRVVLDTNCVVSALLFEHGRMAWLRRAWQREAIIPLADQATLRELIRVLGYPRFSLTPADQHALLGEYLPWVETVADTPSRAWPNLADPNDAPFLDLAAAAQAQYLVSGDADLLQLAATVTHVRIVSPAGLLEILWDDFFQGPGVAEDFMREREQPSPRERPAL